MKLKQQLPNTACTGNIFFFLAVVTLTGTFLSVLVTGTGVYDNLRMGKIFFFVQWMLLFIPMGVVIFIRKWKQPVGLLSLMVLLWFGWVIVRGKTGGIVHDEKFFWLAACFAFFFLAGDVFEGAVKKEQRWLLFVPVLVITLVAATEAVMGLLQLYGRYTVYHHLFKVTGTFFNPAPYAGFLVACLPWTLLLHAGPAVQRYRRKEQGCCPCRPFAEEGSESRIGCY